MYFVYILYSKKVNRYYVGQSENPTERLIAHNSGISRYTSIASDWIIVHLEEYQTRTEAIQRERAIKKMKSRLYIESHFQN